VTGRDNTAFGSTSSGASALSGRKEPMALRTLKLPIISKYPPAKPKALKTVSRSKRPGVANAAP